MDLNDLRAEIDQIDDQLIQLFAARMDIAAKIAEFKKENHLPVLVPSREQKKLLDVRKKARPDMAEYTCSLFSTLFELSRSYQSSHLDAPAVPSKKCGLLGRKLSHSYSPQIHSMLGDYSYTLFEKEPEELEEFLKSGDFTGINVTIPYKKAVIPYLDDLSPIAKELGAVNTVIRRPDGTLYGHNTDYSGFRAMVATSGLSVTGKKALILGSGGASATAATVLKQLGADVVVISRTGENHYGNLSNHANASLIVNATPVGMYPETGISPVDLSLFPKLEGILDMIYNPARTQLLMDAEIRGLTAVNGLLMLVAQAKEAAEYFTGSPVSDDKICHICSMLSGQMQNIVLIGMPGCGKSTVGKLLAEKCGKRFVDADEEIITLAGKSIPEIFRQDGEEVFRELETQVLSTLGKQSGLVIATGGGCVTRNRNYPLLHQNGHILWIRRSEECLATEGRPLSQSGNLTQMYAEREPLYHAFADFFIENNATPMDAVTAILEKLEVNP